MHPTLDPLATRPSTVGALRIYIADELGWPLEDERTEFLTTWLARHLALVRAWNRDRASPRPDPARAARSYNRNAELLALELAGRLGISAARRIAELVPLWRVDEDSGEIHRSTLSGERVGDSAA